MHRSTGGVVPWSHGESTTLEKEHTDACVKYQSGIPQQEEHTVWTPVVSCTILFGITLTMCASACQSSCSGLANATARTKVQALAGARG